MYLSLSLSWSSYLSLYLSLPCFLFRSCLLITLIKWSSATGWPTKTHKHISTYAGVHPRPLNMLTPLLPINSFMTLSKNKCLPSLIVYLWCLHLQRKYTRQCVLGFRGRLSAWFTGAGWVNTICTIQSVPSVLFALFALFPLYYIYYVERKAEGAPAP